MAGVSVDTGAGREMVRRVGRGLVAGGGMALEAAKQEAPNVDKQPTGQLRQTCHMGGGRSSPRPEKAECSRTAPGKMNTTTA